MDVPACRTRRLVVIAVSDYGDNNADFSKGVIAQVEFVTGWLTDPDLGADRQFAAASQQTLHSVQQVRDFLHDQKLAAARRGETIVVYITGHGQLGPFSRRHYLRFAQTDDERLPGTALTTSEVIASALGSQAEHVLVMVDSCHAGALDVEVRAVLRDLGPSRHKLPSLAVVTAGDFDDKPSVGAFTQLLERALERIGAEESGFADPYLSFGEWEQVLDSISAEERDPGRVEAQWVWPPKRSRAPSPCLPNPRYRAPQHQLGNAVRELPDAAGLFANHWRDRASGRTNEEDQGWYFTGRHQAMQKLVTFLRGGDGVLVVTGAAGSGKSALLARLVTLTDRVFLSQPRFAQLADAVPDEERPPTGSVDAAVLARNKTSLTLVEDLLQVSGAGPVPARTAPLQALLEHLAAIAGRGQVTVVIDGLDEAQEPMACLNDVVLPVARLRGADRRPLVRLLLGVRSSPPMVHGQSAPLRDENADSLMATLVGSLQDDHRQRVRVTVLRTDGADCEEDIAAYAQALLCGREFSPYADQTDRAWATAREVARVVTPSFLDARLAADQLLNADQLQDLAEEAWLDRLRSGTTALLREDLHDVARQLDIPVHVLMCVLRATAFAFGTGLPWAEVWPTVAAALEGTPDQSADIEVFVRAIRAVQSTRLSGYLATSEEDGRTTYRPAHQRVAETLLNDPVALVDTLSGDERLAKARRHARITIALARLVPTAGDHPAHPYVRRHLLAHAAAGGVLDGRRVPARLLAQETSGTLRALLGLPLPGTRGGDLKLTAAALIEPYLTPEVDSSSRLSSINFHRAVMRHRLLPAPASGLVAPRWGNWASATNVLASPREHVHALCVLQRPDGRSLVAAGTKAGAHIWDSSSGQHLADLPAGYVQDMCPVRTNSGRVFLATAGPRGVAIWDPLSGLQAHQARVRGATGIQVLADGPSRWRLLVQGQYPMLWNPELNDVVPVPTNNPEHTPTSRLSAVLHSADGRPLLAWQTHRGLAVVDPDTGTVVAEQEFPTALRGLIRVRRESQGDLLLSTMPQRTFTWDPGTGQVRQLGSGATHHPVQFPEQDGHVAVALEYKGRAEVWDFREGEWQRAADVEVGPITALAALPSRHQQWRVATADDVGVRLWEPGATVGGTTGSRTGRWPTPLSPTALCTIEQVRLDGEEPHDLWAVGTADGVDILAPGNARKLRHLPTGPVRALYPLPSHNGDALLAVQVGRAVDVWDLTRHHEPVSRGEGQRAVPGRLRVPPSCVIGWTPSTRALVTVAEEALLVTEIPSGRTYRRGAGVDRYMRSLLAVPSPDGLPWVALGCRGGVLIWDMANDRAVTELPLRARATYARVMGLLRIRDETLLAAATSDRIQLWDTATWAARADIAASRTKALTGVSLPSGGSLLASGDGHAARLWNPLTGELVHTLVTAAPVETLASANSGDHCLLGIGGTAGLAAITVMTGAAQSELSADDRALGPIW